MAPGVHQDLVAEGPAIPIEKPHALSDGEAWELPHAELGGPEVAPA